MPYQLRLKPADCYLWGSIPSFVNSSHLTQQREERCASTMWPVPSARRGTINATSAHSYSRTLAKTGPQIFSHSVHKGIFLGRGGQVLHVDRVKKCFGLMRRGLWKEYVDKRDVRCCSLASSCRGGVRVDTRAHSIPESHQIKARIKAQFHNMLTSQKGKN